jgi:hypothetical protein
MKSEDITRMNLFGEHVRTRCGHRAQDHNTLQLRVHVSSIVAYPALQKTCIMLRPPVLRGPFVVPRPFPQDTRPLVAPIF